MNYQAHKSLSPLVFSFCQKASATAFSSNALVASQDFKILTGQDSLVTYQSSPDKLRYYCSHWHSQVYHTKDDTPDKITLKLGTIDHCDQVLTAMERKHIFNDQTFPWLADK